MKSKPSLFTLLLSATCLLAGTLTAATPEQEKTFIEKYKSAFLAGDKSALESFLYTQGANPQALEFYRATQARGLGGEITDVYFLLPLSTPEDVARVAEGAYRPWRAEISYSAEAGEEIEVCVGQANQRRREHWYD